MNVARLLAAPLTVAVAAVAAPAAGSTPATTDPEPRRPGTRQVTTIAVPAAGGRVLYVAPHGRDRDARGHLRDDNTEQEPWQTLQMAIRRAIPGDVIVLRAGVYTENAGWGAVPASAAAPIVLQAHPGERVVVQGAFQLVRADYWTVTGIHFRPRPGNHPRSFVVKFNGGTGWRFEGNEVSDAPRVSNVFVTGTVGAPRDFVISANCIHDVRAGSTSRGNDHNVYLATGTGSTGLVEHNLIYGSRNGAAIKASGTSSAALSPANITIQHNTLAAAGSGVTVGLTARGIVIDANLMTAAGTGRGFDTGVKGYSLTGTGNRAIGNLIHGWDYPVRVNKASRTKIAAARNTTRNPGFTGTGCTGYIPAPAVANRYGYTAG